MADGPNVGNAHVTVGPDTSGWDAELQRQLDEKRASKDVTVNPDLKRFQPELDAKLKSIKSDISSKINLDDNGIASKLRQAVDKAQAGAAAEVKTNLDFAGFSGKLKSAVDTAAAQVKADIETNVNSAGLRERLKGEVDKASADVKAEVQASVNSSGLRESVTAAARVAEANQRITVRADADTSRLEGSFTRSADAVTESFRDRLLNTIPGISGVGGEESGRSFGTSFKESLKEELARGGADSITGIFKGILPGGKPAQDVGGLAALAVSTVPPVAAGLTLPIVGGATAALPGILGTAAALPFLTSAMQDVTKAATAMTTAQTKYNEGAKLSAAAFGDTGGQAGAVAAILSKQNENWSSLTVTQQNSLIALRENNNAYKTLSQSQKDSLNALLAEKAAYDALDPSQQKALTAQQALHTTFNQMKQDVEPQILGAVTSAYQALNAILGPTEPLIKATANAWKEVFDNVTAGAGSAGYKSFVDDMAGAAHDSIVGFSTAIINLAKGLGGLFDDFTQGGLGDYFLKWLDGVTQEFANWSTSQRGIDSLTKFTGTIEKDWPIVLDVLKDLTKFIADLWNAFAGDPIALQGIETILHAVGWLGGTEVGQTLIQLATLATLLKRVSDGLYITAAASAALKATGIGFGSTPSAPTAESTAARVVATVPGAAAANGGSSAAASAAASEEQVAASTRESAAAATQAAAAEEQVARSAQAAALSAEEMAAAQERAQAAWAAGESVQLERGQSINLSTGRLEQSSSQMAAAASVAASDFESAARASAEVAAASQATVGDVLKAQAAEERAAAAWVSAATESEAASEAQQRAALRLQFASQETYASASAQAAEATGAAEKAAAAEVRAGLAWEAAGATARGAAASSAAAVTASRAAATEMSAASTNGARFAVAADGMITDVNAAMGRFVVASDGVATDMRAAQLATARAAASAEAAALSEARVASATARSAGEAGVGTAAAGAGAVEAGGAGAAAGKGKIASLLPAAATSAAGIAAGVAVIGGALLYFGNKTRDNADKAAGVIRSSSGKLEAATSVGGTQVSKQFQNMATSVRDSVNRTNGAWTEGQAKLKQVSSGYRGAAQAYHETLQSGNDAMKNVMVLGKSQFGQAAGIFAASFGQNVSQMGKALKESGTKLEDNLSTSINNMFSSLGTAAKEGGNGAVKQMVANSTKDYGDLQSANAKLEDDYAHHRTQNVQQDTEALATATQQYMTDANNGVIDTSSAQMKKLGQDMARYMKDLATDPTGQAAAKDFAQLGADLKKPLDQSKVTIAALLDEAAKSWTTDFANAINGVIKGATADTKNLTAAQAGTVRGLGGKATGGYISGPGTGTSDSIPTMLSDGEFVVNAAATSANLPLLHTINKMAKGGLVKGYADGGVVTPTIAVSTGPIAVGNTVDPLASVAKIQTATVKGFSDLGNQSAQASNKAFDKIQQDQKSNLDDTSKQFNTEFQKNTQSNQNVQQTGINQLGRNYQTTFNQNNDASNRIQQAGQNALGRNYQTTFNQNNDASARIQQAGQNQLGRNYQTTFNANNDASSRIQTAGQNALGRNYQTTFNLNNDSSSRIQTAGQNALGRNYQTTFNANNDASSRIQTAGQNALGRNYQATFNLNNDASNRIQTAGQNALGRNYQATFNANNDASSRIQTAGQNALGKNYQTTFNANNATNSKTQTTGINALGKNFSTDFTAMATNASKVIGSQVSSIATSAQTAANTALNSAKTAISSSAKSLGGTFKFANGGHVSGPGTSRSDSIPAMLSDGEFVVNAKSTAANLPLLHKINKFADGGLATTGAVDPAYDDSAGAVFGTLVDRGIAAIDAAAEKAISKNIDKNRAAAAASGGQAGMYASAGPKVNFDGVTLDTITVNQLKKAFGFAGGTFGLSQGSFSSGVAASAGTHSGGGALDVAGVGSMSTERQIQVVKGLRQAGFAAWRRTPAEGFVDHIHGELLGDPIASPEAKAQWPDYFAHKDGLAGHGPDNNPIDVKAGWFGSSAPQSSIGSIDATGAGNQRGWAQDLLKGLGEPLSAANLKFVYDWELSEGGPAQNPLNVGIYSAGTAQPNHSVAAGLASTVAAINQGYYTGIRSALGNSDYNAATHALWASPWAASHYGNGSLWSTAAYAKGTDGAAPGWAKVGEQGEEWMYMNGGEVVLPHGVNPPVPNINSAKGYAAGTGAEGKLSGDIYKIAFGDTLSQIAARFNDTVRYLQNLNDIKNPNLIYAGDSIRIAGGSSSSTSQAKLTANIKSRLTSATHTEALDQGNVTKLTGEYNDARLRALYSSTASQRDVAAREEAAYKVKLDAADKTLASAKANEAALQKDYNAITAAKVAVAKQTKAQIEAQLTKVNAAITAANTAGAAFKQTAAGASGTDLGTDPSLLGGSYTTATSTLKSLAKNIKTLATRGLNKGIIGQILAMDPGAALDYSKELLGTTNIKTLNAQYASYQSELTGYTSSTEDSIYGTVSLAKQAAALTASAKHYADGGMITEPIFGFGASGQAYTFGERESELIVPASSLGGSSNSSPQQVAQITCPINIGGEHVEEVVFKVLMDNERNFTVAMSSGIGS